MRELISTKALSEAIHQKWEQSEIRLKDFPMIQTFPMPFYVPVSQSPDIWIFTSQRSVESIRILLKKYSLHILRNKKIAAIGHKTTDALGALGFRVTVRANNALVLAEKINEHFHAQQVLHFCGDKRRHELSERLHELGFTVTEKKVYQTLLTPKEVIWGKAEGALFFSPSAVESYLQANKWPKGKIAYAIGPTTQAALQQAGITPIFSAKEPNRDALLQAVMISNDVIVGKTDQR